ncbi:MAG: hypothetical protein HUU50_12695 [Candidatus Brocadiae bacterium]|nr:hypothetical protein [Candidatus Brocadiia bacterium]
MGIKTKCEHCWKVFEVPDDAILKQRQCHFCQRLTMAKPLVEEEEKTEKKVYWQLYPVMNSTVFVLFFLTLCNFYLLFRGNPQEERIKEIFQETTEWQNKIQSSISTLEQKIKAYEQLHLQNKAQTFTSETISVDLVRSLESSIKLIHERIIRQQNILKKLEQKLGLKDEKK